MNQAKIENIVVVGGGSAGFISALTLKIKFPELKVTLIKSDNIPIIGVGEGTTGYVPRFFHEFMGLDRKQFYKEARPSWKLGIRYIWGPPEESHFNYTFDPTLDTQYSILKHNNAYYYLNGLKDGALATYLMDTGKSCCFQAPDGINFRLEPIAYGYHIENKTFVAYLEGQAAQFGIEVITGDIIEVRQKLNKEIKELKLDSGESISADLYIDCSGFKSLLLGETLKEKYISFKDSLFCDSAVTGSWDREVDEPIMPYTTAETMDSGWAWKIELRDRINRGYVYSSSFISDENALKELKSKNPRMKDTHRVVRFKTGRYKNFWVKNVAAVGNSAGFVEPLESTGLHMICEELKRIVECLHDSDLRPTETLKANVNEIVGGMWDDIRWFLSLHYKFNTRLNTPFWKHCREKTNTSGVKTLLDFYEENGPSVLSWNLIDKHSMFKYEGYMSMLVLQKAPTKYKYEVSPEEKAKWNMIVERTKNIASRAISMDKALNLIDSPAWSWGEPAKVTAAKA